LASTGLGGILAGVRELLDAVAAACAGVDGLQAAVVFGSVLGGRAPHDLDVALLPRVRPNRKQ
jgi:hypothetical protein